MTLVGTQLTSSYLVINPLESSERHNNQRAHARRHEHNDMMPTMSIGLNSVVCMSVDKHKGMISLRSKPLTHATSICQSSSLGHSLSP